MGLSYLHWRMTALSCAAAISFYHAFQRPVSVSGFGQQFTALRPRVDTYASVRSASSSVTALVTTLRPQSIKLYHSSQQPNPSLPVKKRNKILVQGRRRKRPVALNHERDFFRQAARLESMDSYLLVSTLTASMSFGALLGFSPSMKAAEVATFAAIQLLSYNVMCGAIPVVAGMSAIFGLYATIIFSLTVLYGKSALGAERDLEYDKFLKRTVRPRVHGARCFTLSLSLFAAEAFLVLLERTFHRPWFLVVFVTTVSTLWYLYRDWRLIFRMAEYIYKD